MSIENIYDKISVRLGDGLYMPFLLHGDSRHFDISGRLIRKWSAWMSFTGKHWQSADNWCADCEVELIDADCDRDMFCHKMLYDIKGTNNTFENYKGLFVRATKKAIAFEDLVGEFNVQVVAIGLDDNGETFRVNVNTVEQLKEAVNLPGNRAGRVWFELCGAPHDLGKWVRRFVGSQAEA